MIYYFLIILDTHIWNIIYIIYFLTFYPFYNQLFKQIHLILIMPYLYLSYKPIIKVSHIITYTSNKYENKHTNICLQLGRISSYKQENTGLCGIALWCPGCISRNHTLSMVGIEKSNIHKYLKYYMGWNIIVFWEGLAVKIWSLRLEIVCLSLLSWSKLCKWLVTSMWGSWVQN